MTSSRLFAPFGGLPRAAIAVALAASMITAGVGGPPVSCGESSLAGEDQRPDSQPCEEPQEDSSEDEEDTAGKHAAIVGISVSVDPPAARGAGRPVACGLVAGGMLVGVTPIRGPPRSA